MDDEGVVPGVDQAESHCQARHHRAYGEAHNLIPRSPKIMSLFFDLVSTKSKIRAYYQIHAYEESDFSYSGRWIEA